MKGQVNVVDMTKLLSPIHSSFAALVVQYVVRHCRGEELGPFCSPILAAGFEVFVHLINLLSIHLRCYGFTGIQKAIVDQMGSRPPDSDHDLLLVQVWLWEVLWSFVSVQSLSLEKAMAPHSSTLAWKIPWTEEPGRLQSMGSWRVGHDWETSLSLFTFMHRRRKWQPTPVFLPGESKGRGSLVGFHLWGHIELDTTAVSDLAAAVIELVFAGCHIKSAFHCTSQTDQKMVHYCCIE